MSSNRIFFRLTVDDLTALFTMLSAQHYTQIGPVAKDGAIMLDELQQFDDIPTGFYEIQRHGKYRIEDKKDGSYFRFTLGPQSFKQYLHPPKRKLWQAKKENQNFTITPGPDPEPMVFWGVRNCDLAAIKTLDRVFLQKSFPNAWYQKARDKLVIIAVSCSHPSSNCFCTSMGHGPKAEADFDLNLTALTTGKDAVFLAEVGTEKAQQWIEHLGAPLAKESDIQQASDIVTHSVEQMQSKPEMQKAEGLLKENLDNSFWEDVANRCLSCANCTMVCPTCFCTSTEDVTDLTGNHTERWLAWDSCFNGDFSYIHGGIIRGNTKSRYRQWITHKLAHWHDQFDQTGCVGCGRCITWCPVGIDITEEIQKLNRSTQENKKKSFNKLIQ